MCPTIYGRRSHNAPDLLESILTADCGRQRGVDRRKFIGAVAGNLVTLPVAAVTRRAAAVPGTPAKRAKEDARVAASQYSAEHRDLRIGPAGKREYHRLLWHHVRSRRTTDVPVRGWPRSIAGNRHQDAEHGLARVGEPVSLDSTQRNDAGQWRQQPRKVDLNQSTVRPAYLQHDASWRGAAFTCSRGMASPIT